jgi:ATP-dependent DNA helicase RecQ
VTILALTATASDDTIQYIKTSLLQQHVQIVKAPMLRSNLHLSVLPRAGPNNRIAQLCSMLLDTQPMVIVYCNEIRTCASLQQYVAEHLPLRLDMFHGDLCEDRKGYVLQRCHGGEVDVLFCTLAFGMGIDLRVQSVIHWDVPYDMDTYVQEIGRAGRDGSPAKCIMLHEESWFEKALHRFRKTPGTMQECADAAAAMRRYLHSATCRHKYLLCHFSAVDDVVLCHESCDNCAGSHTM